MDDDVLATYTEMEVCDLKLQLQVFRRKRPTQSAGETLPVYTVQRAIIQDTRGEYSKMDKLVRILLVGPASSVEIETSFSALKRLKTCSAVP
jgi:hypothetical protein